METMMETVNCPHCGRDISSTQMEVKTQGKCMFGTSHWYGTIDSAPALVVSWHGGAGLWVFEGEWKRIKCFDSLAKAYEFLGVEQ